MKFDLCLKYSGWVWFDRKEVFNKSLCTFTFKRHINDGNSSCYHEEMAINVAINI